MRSRHPLAVEPMNTQSNAYLIPASRLPENSPSSLAPSSPKTWSVLPFPPVFSFFVVMFSPTLLPWPLPGPFDLYFYFVLFFFFPVRLPSWHLQSKNKWGTVWKPAAFLCHKHLQEDVLFRPKAAIRDPQGDTLRSQRKAKWKQEESNMWRHVSATVPILKPAASRFCCYFFS